MPVQTIRQQKNQPFMPMEIAKAIFEEIRLLRNEVSLLLPQDDLNKYANPKKICRAYEKAVKKYPPATSL